MEPGLASENPGTCDSNGPIILVEGFWPLPVPSPRDLFLLILPLSLPGSGFVQGALQGACLIKRAREDKAMRAPTQQVVETPGNHIQYSVLFVVVPSGPVVQGGTPKETSRDSEN